MLLLVRWGRSRLLALPAAAAAGPLIVTVPWGHRSVAAVGAGAGAVLCRHWCCHLRQADSGDGAAGGSYWLS